MPSCCTYFIDIYKSLNEMLTVFFIIIEKCHIVENPQCETINMLELCDVFWKSWSRAPICVQTVIVMLLQCICDNIIMCVCVCLTPTPTFPRTYLWCHFTCYNSLVYWKVCASLSWNLNITVYNYISRSIS